MNVLRKYHCLAQTKKRTPKELNAPSYTVGNILCKFKVKGTDYTTSLKRQVDKNPPATAKDQQQDISADYNFQGKEHTKS